MKVGMPLNNHIAVVTGAGSGIGYAMATRLAQESIPIVAADIDYQSASKTADDIKTAGGKATPVKADVSQTKDVRKIFNHCEENFGPCTLLCNNAGHAQQKPFLDITIDDFDHMIAVHMRGMFLCAQTVLPKMLSSGDGVIINTASQLGYLGAIELAHYAAAKSGIIGLTRSMAREFSKTGVRIFAIAPGATRTPIFDSISDDWLQAKASQLPLGRFAEPSEIAETAVFLASPLSAAFVGQTLNPNSGDIMV